MELAAQFSNTYELHSARRVDQFIYVSVPTFGACSNWVQISSPFSRSKVSRSIRTQSLRLESSSTRLSTISLISNAKLLERATFDLLSVASRCHLTREVNLHVRPRHLATCSKTCKLTGPRKAKEHDREPKRFCP